MKPFDPLTYCHGGTGRARRREARTFTLTVGQLLHRVAQHAKVKHPPGIDWCSGCFDRWGYVFPSMQLARRPR